MCSTVRVGDALGERCELCVTEALIERTHPSRSVLDAAASSNRARYGVAVGDFLAELRAAAADARDTWPGVELNDEDFAQHVQALGWAEGAGLHLTDLYLALGCARQCAGAAAHFESLAASGMAAAARRINPERDFVAETQQRARERILVGPEPRILSYRGNGPLRNWAIVCTIRVAMKLRRAQGAIAEPDEGWTRALDVADSMDLELEAFKARHRKTFSAALRSACAQLDARERAVLRLHYFEGVGIDKLASTYGVHRATAARWVARARQTLHEATQMHLRASEGLRPDDVGLIERLVHSQLSVSFSGLAPDND